MVASASTVDTTQVEGRTPMSLHKRADEGDLDGIRAALDEGADLQARNVVGYAPLHLAIAKGHVDAVALLLERILRLLDMLFE